MEFKQDTHAFLITSFQCVIHIENIFAHLSERVSMKSVMHAVINIVICIKYIYCIYICANARIHDQFMDFLKEIINSEFNYLVFFANVHWLNCGRFLQVFIVLLTPIQDFIETKEMPFKYPIIKEKTEEFDLCFLTGITLHMNELNFQIPRKVKAYCNLARQVR